MIDTGTSEPVSHKPYPITMKHYQWVKDEIEKLLTAKVIWGGWSSWSAPIIVIPKEDGGKCLVIDYSALNKVTRKFTWPMPKVEDIFSQLNGAKYFSTLGLWAGYHISLWMKHPYERLPSPHPLESTNISKYLLDSHKHISRLPRTHDWNIKGFQLHHCLFGWHHHLYQDSRWASRPHKKVFEDPPANETPSGHQPITMLFNTRGISHPSTNIALSKSKEMLHSLYRCIRWCLWSTAVSGTWWNRIPNSFPFTYLH